jgi:WD40 repeat protein
MRLTSLLIGLSFCAGAHAAPPAVSTSDFIAQGAGQRQTRSVGPLMFGSWPVPLHHVTAATMASTVSPDGRLLVVAGGYGAFGGRLVVWDLESSKPLVVKHTDRGIRRVRFVPNTELLVVAGYDGKARLMEARTGRHIREYSRHTDTINGIAISVDGSRLATGAHDTQVMLWNLQTGQHLRTFAGHTDDVLAVAFVPTEPLLVSAGRDKRVLIWNIDTGEKVAELTGPASDVEDIAVSPSGKVIAAASNDQRTWLFNRETGNVFGTLPAQQGRLVCVDFSPEGAYLAMGGYDGHVTIWDYAQQAELARIQAHQSPVYAVTFTEDGQKFSSHGWSGDAKLWKNDGTLLGAFPVASAPQRAVAAVAWAPDEECFAVLDQAGGIRLIIPGRIQESANFRQEGPQVAAVGFTGDGQLITGHADGSLRKVSRTGVASDPLASGSAPVDGVTRISSAGPHAVVVQFQNGRAARLDVEKQQLAMLGEFTDVVQAATDSGLDWFATLHQPGSIRFWDAASGKPLTGDLTLPEGASPQKLAITSVGSRLLCAGASGLHNYRIARSADEVRWELTRFLPIVNGPLQSLAVSPDGQTVIGGLPDGTLRVAGIDGTVGALLKRDATTGPATEIVFGPRSQRLITVHQSQGWIWDLDTANAEIQPLASFTGHDKGARSVCFAQDDRLLVTTGFDSKSWVWDLATGERRPLPEKGSTSICAVSPDSRIVAVGQFPTGLDLRDVESLKVEQEFEKPPRGPYTLAISTDQKRLVATYFDKGLMVYDVSNPAPIVSLPPDTLPWTFAAFSPDGTTFVSCTGDYKQTAIPGSIRLHESTTGKVLKTFQGHTGDVKFACFDLTGNRLATATADKMIRIYDIASGAELNSLKLSDSAFSMEFIPESDLIIAGDYRGLLRLWDIKSKKVVQALKAHGDMLQRMAFSRDRSTLATAGRDGAVKLWKIVGEGNLLRVQDSAR